MKKDQTGLGTGRKAVLLLLFLLLDARCLLAIKRDKVISVAKKKLAKPWSEGICTNKVTENPSILILLDVFVVLHYLKFNLVDMWITAQFSGLAFHGTSHICSWHDG